MQEKILPSKEPANRKGWGLTSSIQQNGRIKRKFTALFNQVHDMLKGGEFNTYLSNGLWAKAVNTAMLLKNKLLTPNITLSHFNNFWEGKEKHPVFDTKIW